MARKILGKSSWIVFVALLCLSFPSIATSTPAEKANQEKIPTIETTAESAILMEAHTGQILLEKNPHKELPMASVTKLMTLLLALEAVDRGDVKLTDMVTVSEHAWHMGGSQIYLEPGESMSMKEMLISIAVGSANDASVAVAEHLDGTMEAFVDSMNQRAKALGLANTHFANPTGLPAENHYSSAYDLGKILQACLGHPLFKEISGIYEYDLRDGKFKLWSTNKLLKWYPGVDAGKTGWTNAAKYCLASSCERDGLRLIAVVMGTPEARSHFRETIKLYNWGYAKYQALPLAAAGKVVKTVDVAKGIEEKLDLITAQQISLVIPKGKNKGITTKIDVPEKINAPVKKGQTIGQYVVYQDNKEILKVPIQASQTVEKAPLWTQMNRILLKLYDLH